MGQPDEPLPIHVHGASYIWIYETDIEHVSEEFTYTT